MNEGAVYAFDYDFDNYFCAACEINKFAFSSLFILFKSVAWVYYT